MILEELREQIEQEQQREKERKMSYLHHPDPIHPGRHTDFLDLAEKELTSHESVDYSMDIEESCIDGFGIKVERLTVNDKLQSYKPSLGAPHKSDNILPRILSGDGKELPTKEELNQEMAEFKRQSVKLEPTHILPLAQAPPETPLQIYTPDVGFDLNADESFGQLSFILNRQSQIGPRVPENMNSILEGSILLRTVELNTAQTPEQRGEILIKITQRQNQMAAMGNLQKQIIELPDCHIVIAKEPLVIRSPILFHGSPGTVIEVETSIIVDIDSAFYADLMPALANVSTLTEFAVKPIVQFSECVIKFNRAPGDGPLGEVNNKSVLPLFLINRGSKLVMRDCQLKTLVFQNFINNSRIDYGEVEDVCFHLVNLKRTATSTAVSSQISRLQNQKGETALHVVSCTMDGFSHMIMGAEDATIHIELSSLTGARGSAIDLINPLKLQVQRSIIEKALGNAAVIRFHGQEGVIDNKFEREVIFDAAIIMGNVGCGIVVMGEKDGSLASVITEPQEESKQMEQKIGASIAKSVSRREKSHFSSTPKLKLLEVRKTRIYHCKKDGIMIKNITLHPQNGVVRLDSNQFQNNKDNNIWLYGIHRPQQNAHLSLFDDQFHHRICAFVLHSRIYDAETGYGVYAYDTNVEIQDSEILGNASGGIMMLGKKEVHSPSEIKADLCRIIQSTIKSNKQSGIIINQFQGFTEIARCEVSDNSKCGIAATQRLETASDIASVSTQAQLLSPHNNRGAHQIPVTTESIMDHRSLVKVPPAQNLKMVQKSGASVKIEICDISYNGDHGILLRNVELSVKQSRIQNNSNNAISMDEASKLCLKILECNGSQRRLIMGPIGGSWGNISPSACSGDDNRNPFYAGIEGATSSMATIGQDQQRKRKQKELQDSKSSSNSKKCRCFPSQASSSSHRAGLTSNTELHTAVSQTHMKNSEYL